MIFQKPVYYNYLSDFKLFLTFIIISAESLNEIISIITTGMFIRRSLHGVMAKVLDCSLKVSEFKLQSCYYVHIWTNAFEKGMEPLIFLAMG